MTRKRRPSWAVALRKARKERGLSITKAAKAVGCSPSTWANWEAGAFFPQRVWRPRIKRKFGVDLNGLRQKRKKK